jgi:hypothetical protein
MYQNHAFDLRIIKKSGWNAYEAGITASLDNKPILKNPHDFHSHEGLYWDFGWIDSELHKMKVRFDCATKQGSK